MITVALESFTACLEELQPLFEPHWQELALDQAHAPLDPQYEVYIEREARGELLCVIARDRGKICAYFLGFIAPGLHYRRTLTLTMDIFWLEPSYRDADSLSRLEAGLLSTQLFDLVIAEARRRGVKRCFFGSKNHADSTALFAHYGMHEVERYYSVFWE